MERIVAVILSLTLTVLGCRSKNQIGVDADSALHTSPSLDARDYIVDKYTCPRCEERGNKKILGHMTVAQKLTDGQKRVYDVYSVFCDCGEFSVFWSDSSSWIGADYMEVVEFLCPPDGKMRWITKQGQFPEDDPSLSVLAEWPEGKRPIETP